MRHLIITSLFALPFLALASEPASAFFCIVGQKSCIYHIGGSNCCAGCNPGCGGPCGFGFNFGGASPIQPPCPPPVCLNGVPFASAAPRVVYPAPSAPATQPNNPSATPASFQTGTPAQAAPAATPNTAAQANAYQVPSYWYGR